MSAGVIYILTNPSFPDYVKIGYADNIDTRLRQLNRSECIPFAFRVYATYEVDSRLSDKKIHAIIDKLNRIIPNVDEVQAEETAQEIDTESIERASNFSFSKCQIPVGEFIEYYGDPTILAEVVDDRNVRYNEQTMSLTALAKMLSGKRYSVAGPRFFKYKGEWLNDIRRRLGV
ncbi:MAG: GIY-YIG nuclease family protein [Lachnospiraceae bacterium]|nr:GIY-YIG nuclease family protein [Lachnospiraceae bacterium]MDE6981130.1 GIY-YIG nuclease family protein [Lachnospiraceae bacterium]